MKILGINSSQALNSYTKQSFGRFVMDFDTAARGNEHNFINNVPYLLKGETGRQLDLIHDKGLTLTAKLSDNSQKNAVISFTLTNSNGEVLAKTDNEPPIYGPIIYGFNKMIQAGLDYQA